MQLAVASTLEEVLEYSWESTGVLSKEYWQSATV